MKEIFTQSASEERIANLFRALGNPARVWIITELAKSPRSAGDLVARLPLAQSTVSEHLGVLKAAGIVSTGKSARIYQLDAAVFDTVIDYCNLLSGGQNRVSADDAGRFRTPVTSHSTSAA